MVRNQINPKKSEIQSAHSSKGGILACERCVTVRRRGIDARAIFGRCSVPLFFRLTTYTMGVKLHFRAISYEEVAC